MNNISLQMVSNNRLIKKLCSKLSDHVCAPDAMKYRFKYNRSSPFFIGGGGGGVGSGNIKGSPYKQILTPFLLMANLDKNKII